MQQLTPYLQWRAWPLIALCLLLFAWALLAGRMAKTL
jgi:apolipoprotein N-acyltransferase